MMIDRRVLAAALAMGTLAAAGAAPPDPRYTIYTTGCIAIDSNTVEGFVTNPGPGPLQLTGSSRFLFSLTNQPSRPAVSVPVNSLVPPGQTLCVARAQLDQPIVNGETCQLDLSAAIR